MKKVKHHNRQNSSPNLTSTNTHIFNTPKSNKQGDQTTMLTPKINNTNISNCGSAIALKHTSSPPSKFYSFKKIRQDKVRQKDQKGKIILKVKLDHNENRLKTQVFERITDLNDARTITSVQSPRQSDDLNPKLDESQIISRGCSAFAVASNEALTSIMGFMRKKNKISKVYHPQINIFIDKQTGWLCHYQIAQYNIDKNVINKLKLIPTQYLLQLYAQHRIPGYKFLLIYEPYQFQLSVYLNKCKIISFQTISEYLMQLITIMINFRNRQIFPVLKINNIYLAQDKIKLKLNSLLQFGSQRQILRDLGKIGEIFIIYKNKIRNFTKLKQLRYKSLINDLIEGYQNTLEDVYVRLNCLKEQ